MTEIEWLDIFATHLIEILDENRMSQKELAEATGLSEASISGYVNRTKLPGVKAIINISYVLNLDLNDFMDFGDMIES